MSVLLLPVLVLLSCVQASRDSRLGQLYTTVPLQVSAEGNPVVQVGIGQVGSVTPLVNLSLSTTVNYLLLAVPDCDNCVDETTASIYDPDRSETGTESELALRYSCASPFSSTGDKLNITGVFAQDIIFDPRSDHTPRTIVLVDSFGEKDGSSWKDGKGFGKGEAGIWGLGYDQVNPANSLIPQVMASDPGISSLTVGIDLFARARNVQQDIIGNMHWGGIPDGAWVGDWNWIHPLGSGASVWAIRLDKLEIDGKDINKSKQLRATIQPAISTIAVPNDVAVEVYSHIDGAVRDKQQTDRWNIPCPSSPTLQIHLPGGTYTLNSTLLVQQKSANTCWGAIVAWPKGSDLDRAGEVLLGYPFLVGVYMGLYYSKTITYVGLANKPGYTAIGFVKPEGNRLSKGAIAGIIIGIIALMLIALGIFASRARDSPAGYYSRMLRRQHKLATVQMMHQYPGMVEPPPLIMGAPPVLSQPRYFEEIYAKPYVPGERDETRYLAQSMDPMMAMYPPTEGLSELSGRGLFGGWRRARQEAAWRNQGGYGSGPGPGLEYTMGNQHATVGHQDPYSQPVPLHPADHPPAPYGHVHVAQGYYGAPHGDPGEYYLHPHETVPQEYQGRMDHTDQTGRHSGGRGSSHRQNHHDDHDRHQHHHRHREHRSEAHHTGRDHGQSGHHRTQSGTVYEEGYEDEGRRGFFGRLFGRNDR